MRGVKPSNFRKSASNVFLQKVLYLLQLRCFRRKNLTPPELCPIHYPGKPEASSHLPLNMYNLIAFDFAVVSSTLLYSVTCLTA
jgi:hypothetical protein